MVLILVIIRNHSLYVFTILDHNMAPEKIDKI